tara:strand:+ start:164 stop:394 length:231 start_codon:yes stop_codon:yes gene_type:complete
MNQTKAELSKQLSDMVDEYLERGGEIIEVPIGVSGNEFKFHGLVIPAKRAQLYGLSHKSKTRPGFDREKILLNVKN